MESAPARFSTDLMPQADTLAHLQPVVEAVAAGLSSASDLAQLLELTERQGHYYRLAAVQLGFVQPKPWQVSTSGNQLLAATTADERRELMIEGFFANPLLRELFDYLGEAPGGRSKEEVAAWLQVQAGLQESTALRRWRSVQKWLVELTLGSVEGGLFSVVARQEAREAATASKLAARYRLEILSHSPDRRGERVEMRGSAPAIHDFLAQLGGSIVRVGGRLQATPGAVAITDFSLETEADTDGLFRLAFRTEDKLPRPAADARNQNTGPLFEETLAGHLRQAGHSYRSQQKIGQRPAGGEHVIDFVVQEEVLVSAKWQQVTGTAQEKIPYEVLSLKKILTDHPQYRKAYLVMGGPGWSPGMKDYCLNELVRELAADSAIEILWEEDFRHRAEAHTL